MNSGSCRTFNKVDLRITHRIGLLFSIECQVRGWTKNRLRAAWNYRSGGTFVTLLSESISGLVRVRSVRQCRPVEPTPALKLGGGFTKATSDHVVGSLLEPIGGMALG